MPRPPRGRLTWNAPGAADQPNERPAANDGIEAPNIDDAIKSLNGAIQEVADES